MLERYRGRDDVAVLALARGRVPVGYEVATALGAPLDVFVRREHRQGRSSNHVHAAPAGTKRATLSATWLPNGSLDSRSHPSRDHSPRRPRSKPVGQPSRSNVTAITRATEPSAANQARPLRPEDRSRRAASADAPSSTTSAATAPVAASDDTSLLIASPPRPIIASQSPPSPQERCNVDTAHGARRRRGQRAEQRGGHAGADGDLPAAHGDAGRPITGSLISEGLTMQEPTRRSGTVRPWETVERRVRADQARRGPAPRWPRNHRAGDERHSSKRYRMWACERAGSRILRTRLRGARRDFRTRS